MILRRSATYDRRLDGIVRIQNLGRLVAFPFQVAHRGDEVLNGTLNKRHTCNTNFVIIGSFRRTSELRSVLIFPVPELHSPSFFSGMDCGFCIKYPNYAS